MIITFIYYGLCVVVTVHAEVVSRICQISYRALTDGCQFALVQKRRQSHL